MDVEEAGRRLAEQFEPRHLLIIGQWLASGGADVDARRVEPSASAGLSDPHADQAA